MKKLLFLLMFLMLLGCSQQEKTSLTETTKLEIINKTQCLAKDKNCSTINFSLDKTNLSWLNSLLLAELSGNETKEAGKFDTEVDNFTAQLNKWFDKSLKEIEEYLAEETEESFSLNYESLGNIKFIDQKANLATFVQHNYIYSGGAHGLYGNQYLLIDLEQQKRIKLEDIIAKNQQDKLFETLKESYKENHPEFFETWLPKNINEQKEYLIIDNFYYTETGITFVYPIYQLAPYSEGEIELSLTQEQLNKIQNKEN